MVTINPVVEGFYCPYCKRQTMKRIPLNVECTQFEEGWYFCVEDSYKLYIKPTEDKQVA